MELAQKHPLQGILGAIHGDRNFREMFVWVAVKELKLSYYIGETLLFTIYTHCGNLIYVP